MPTPEEPSREPSRPPVYSPVVYNEYCYTVQLYASEGDITWAGTYGPNPTREDGKSVKAGVGREGRITGGNITASSVEDVNQQLNDLYGAPGQDYRLISLDKRGVVDLE